VTIGKHGTGGGETPSLDFHGDPFSRPVAMEFRESPQIVAVAVSYLDD
jgi:hypothetical protein